jgi:hypothetical protein
MKRILLVLALLAPLAANAQETPIRTRKGLTTLTVTAVSVSSSATALPTTPIAGRTSICLFNNGAATVFIGPSGVTTSNGFPLAPGAAFCDDANTRSGAAQAYYGIVATGTAEVRVLEN